MQVSSACFGKAKLFRCFAILFIKLSLSAIPFIFRTIPTFNGNVGMLILFKFSNFCKSTTKSNRIVYANKKISFLYSPAAMDERQVPGGDVIKVGIAGVMLLQISENFLKIICFRRFVQQRVAA